MPNGRPGDHPFTDIVNHSIRVFTPEIHRLVRELAATGATDRVADLLWQQETWWARQRGEKLPNEVELNARLLNEWREIQSRQT